MQTSQQNADTGRTTGGSVVIVTNVGTNAFTEIWPSTSGAAALNARFPIESPAPDPKQPFSRQNYIGTIGGPVKKDRLWFFSSLEHIHDDVSIAYSPASRAQFNALASLPSQGSVPAVSSIPVPANVGPVPRPPGYDAP